MGTRNRTAVVMWSVVVIVAATGVAWSLAPMLAAREPDATPVARKADRDAPLARKGDNLIPRVSAPDLAARWVPPTQAVTVDGGLPKEGLPSIEGPSPPPDPPSPAASKPVRAEATPHHRAAVRAEATPHHQAPVRAEATPHHQARNATSACSMIAASDCLDTCPRAACLALHTNR